MSTKSLLDLERCLNEFPDAARARGLPAAAEGEDMNSLTSPTRFPDCERSVATTAEPNVLRNSVPDRSLRAVMNEALPMAVHALRRSFGGSNGHESRPDTDGAIDVN